MGKNFNQWLNDFVEKGFNSQNLLNWPDEGSGTIVVTELPQVGEEHTIYELHTTTPSIISYWIYVNGEWVNIDENWEFETQEKTVNPSTNTQEITPDEGYDGLSKVTVNAVTSAIDSNIKAENIKKDVAILGVTGTYEPVIPTPVLQDKTVAPAITEQVVHADEAYDGLNDVTVSAVTSSIDNNIQAENIKKDVSILGVTGTYEGSSGGATYNIETLQTILPMDIASMGVAQIGNNVYLFGGNGENGVVTRIYKFDTNTKTISTLSATLPQALSNMGVAQIGSNVYLFGGYREGNSANTIYKFDTNTETISTLSVTLPQALSNMGVATVGSDVYLFGGYDSINYVNTFYKFDTDTETITTLSARLAKGLQNIGVATVGSNVYLFGGYRDHKSVNNIRKFDTNTKTISALSVTLPQVLSNMGVVQIGSNVYLFGGFSTKGVNTIYKFNVETETISTLSVTLPQALFGLGVATVGSNVYLFGGLLSSTSKLDTIYKFNIIF